MHLIIERKLSFLLQYSFVQYILCLVYKYTSFVQFLFSGFGSEDDDFEDFYVTEGYTLICRISEKFYDAVSRDICFDKNCTKFAIWVLEESLSAFFVAVVCLSILLLSASNPGHLCV